MAALVEACRLVLRGDEARVERDAAILRLVEEDGVPVRQVEARATAALLAAGFTGEQVRGLGVSYGAARVVAEHRRGRRP